MRHSLFALALAMTPALLAEGRSFNFSVTNPAPEVIATVRMKSAGSDWAETGKEAAVVTISLDSGMRQHLMLFAGPAPYDYKIFLGPMVSGPHTLDVSRNLMSASEAEVEVISAEFKEIPASDPYYPVLAFAPVVFARANTIGKFTDIPLILYCERLMEAGLTVLQYTMIFSNEDGGTSTRALMARWGRTTDIEYIYRVFLNDTGKIVKTTVQGKDHKELPYQGSKFAFHPMMAPVTDNNMMEGGHESALRYQFQPLLVDLRTHPREYLMDEVPVSYQVMYKELVREQKLRPYGEVDGEKISDPRNYIFVDFKVRNRNGGMGVLLRRKGEKQWQTSFLGRADYTVMHDGWVRTTVELPPGTKASDLGEIAFQCLVISKEGGSCELQEMGKIFALGANGYPSAAIAVNAEPVDLRTGQMISFPLAQ